MIMFKFMITAPHRTTTTNIFVLECAGTTSFVEELRDTWLGSW